MLNSPKKSQVSDHKMQATPPFSLREALQSPVKYKIATSLPTEESLNELNKLDENLRIKIAKTFGEIHSYLVDRKPKEEQPLFFHHVAAAALYELYTQRLIFGKNHSKKATDIFHLVNNTLKEIEKAIYHTNDKEKSAVLRTYQRILSVHHNILVDVLYKIVEENDPDKMAFLEKSHKNLLKLIKRKKLLEQKLGEQAKENIRAAYPKTPSPLKKKPRITPKKISEEDSNSIEAIQQLKRPGALTPLFEAAKQQSQLLAQAQGQGQGQNNQISGLSSALEPLSIGSKHWSPIL